MPDPKPAKMLRLHFGEQDRFGSRPLYEAIVERCREMGIAGATVYRGTEGFGETSEVHRAPIVVSIVDTDENIARLLPAVESMIGNGILVTSDVQVIRLQR